MTTTHGFRRVGPLGLSLALLFASLLLIARPSFQNWGATRAEVVRRLPGDDIVPHAFHQETRAIDIDAEPGTVWAWVAQIGQDRAGFYSYEILEDLVGCEMTNLDRLRPDLQVWKIGDKLWMYPPNKLGGIGHAVLRAFEPGRALGFATRLTGTPITEPENGSWSFIVEAVGSNHSRLIVRGRAGGERGFSGTLFDRLVFEPMHFAMERKMMTEIKARAEGRAPRPIADDLEVALWTLAFGVFVGAALASSKVSGSGAWRWAGLCVASGMVFQVLTLVQPSLFASALSALALLLLALPASGFARRLRGVHKAPAIRRAIS